MGVNHKAVYGMTEHGKTWLSKRLAKQYKKRKQIILVYSGVGDLSGWSTTPNRMTSSVDRLEEMLNDPRNFGAFVFLDEITVLFEELSRKKHKTLWGLFMKGRHKGYTIFGITQYPTAMPRRNRVNCSECYCFRLGDEESAKLVFKDYGSIKCDGVPIWQIIIRLQPLQFVHIKHNIATIKQL